MWHLCQDHCISSVIDCITGPKPPTLPFPCPLPCNSAVPPNRWGEETLLLLDSGSLAWPALADSERQQRQPVKLGRERLHLSCSHGLYTPTICMRQPPRTACQCRKRTQAGDAERLPPTPADPGQVPKPGHSHPAQWPWKQLPTDTQVITNDCGFMLLSFGIFF